MRVYLDTNVVNRPFDDQTQPRIWLETLAFAVILQLIDAGSVTLVERVSPAKIARLWAMWQLGRGDYEAVREELFAEETVHTLYDQIRTYQDTQAESSE